VQWKGYVPGLVGAVMVWVPPLLGMTASNRPAVSEVTVWSTPSLLVTVIFAPGLTLVGTMYLKSLMLIFAAAAGVAAGAGEELLAEGLDVPEGVVALAVLELVVLEDALTGGVEVLCPVVDWPPLPQAPRKKTLQVAAIAPAVRRVVIGVRPVSGWRILSLGVRYPRVHRLGSWRTRGSFRVPWGPAGSVGDLWLAPGGSASILCRAAPLVVMSAVDVPAAGRPPVGLAWWARKFSL